MQAKQPIRTRRWLLLVALVVISLLGAVAFRIIGVIRRYDEAMTAKVFRRPEGCVNDVLNRRGAPTFTWTGGDAFIALDAVRTRETTVTLGLPAEGKQDLQAFRAANLELLRCPLQPFERMNGVELNQSLAMLPIDILWQLERGDAEPAAAMCVSAVRFALVLADSSEVGDGSLFIMELEEPCAAALARSPTHQAELDALRMPSFENALESLTFTKLQLGTDTRAVPDWSMRIDRWRRFSREEATWRALIKLADQRGPARAEAAARVEESVEGVETLLELRDGVEDSLRKLQTKR